MKLEMITEGLKQLLQDNNYTPATIRFYEREWNKLQCFLTEEYGNTEYDMERGLKYLENQYGFITKYNDGTLSQQRVQLLRVVHMLEDYRLHLEFHTGTNRHLLIFHPHFSVKTDKVCSRCEFKFISVLTA